MQTENNDPQNIHNEKTEGQRFDEKQFKEEIIENVSFFIPLGWKEYREDDELICIDDNDDLLLAFEVFAPVFSDDWKKNTYAYDDIEALKQEIDISSKNSGFQDYHSEICTYNSIRMVKYFYSIAGINNKTIQVIYYCFLVGENRVFQFSVEYGTDRNIKDYEYVIETILNSITLNG